MQHFQAVKGLNATGGLFHNFPDLFEGRLRMITHPLVKRLTFDVFGGDVYKIADPM